MVTKDSEFMTLIYGDAVSLKQAQAAQSMIESAVKNDIEINLVNGGQPIYHFIISVE